jgi:3-oxoacyl-[acyl-carrier protein] reductase
MKKTVLVIGCAGGIGKKVTEDLLNEGYSVIGTYYNKDSNFIDIKKFHLDLFSDESIESFVKNIDGESLYAIINCAGVCEYEENIDIEKDLDIWNRAIKINLSSNYYLAKYLQKNIEQNGKFVMISSTDAMYGGEITAGYAASKSGVNSLAKSLALLLKAREISVNAIAPGWVNTKMIQETSEEFLKKVASINPQRRIAEPKDISNLVKFLLKEESGYINGQVLTVDGGYTNQDPTLILEEESI